MQPIRFCNQYPALGRYILGLSNGPAFAVASQYIPALSTHIEVTVPLVFAFKVTQQISPTDFDFVNDRLQITGNCCVANGEHIRSAHLPANWLSNACCQTRPQSKTCLNNPSIAQHFLADSIDEYLVC